MSRRKQSNSNILNNLQDHVDSGDVLFVVSGNASNNQQAIDALNKRCKAKCPGRRKLDRNLHSKVVDAAQFVAQCAEARCAEPLKNGKMDGTLIKNEVAKMVSEKCSEKSVVKTVGREKKPKRLDDANSIRIKAQGPPSVDKNRKRDVILRQMKNHRVSTSFMDHGKQQSVMIRPAEKLKALQDVFDDLVSRHTWETKSLDSENISGLMNRIGLSKYGYKIVKKSPYATNEIKKTKRKSRSVIDIVPRHSCFTSEGSRVPSYMGWYWTKCFSKFANAGWRPGAIPKNIRDIMSYFNGPCSCMPNDFRTCVTYNEKLASEQEEETMAVRKPTLKVIRKDGLYYVCMNPLKSSSELIQSQNPYLDDCPPIKFQIALNRQGTDDNDLGMLGYPCTDCPAICEDNKEMQDLLKLLAEECDNDKEFYKLAKTLCAKPSDLDIEFVAPAANLKNKPILKDNVYRQTQYDRNDFEDSFGTVVSRSLPVLTEQTKTAAA